ncbi:hypothetical protein [Cystobacter fuscus]|uniref:hypothetical protein n=1 Tax=Cystobacter fuscus TaxID=43 RepID=UPI002B287561|nr:hypothetical protein F0U63_43590 [Cystobacter fuscus]
MDRLALERKALVRVYLYMVGTFYVSKTVVVECDRIRDEERRQMHDSSISVQFLDLPVQCVSRVDERAAYLLGFHSKQGDCRVLAEAEDLGLNVLLTYDGDFKKRLAPVANAVSVLTPSEYWERLGIARGTPPRRVPDYINPLSKQSWWQW